ncbi:MAG TPA: 50S ribosomal protein L29 [Acidimicrobiia bacterium]|nr:50S ribosomal protein L29 [Acidimicrobiia bacterium]
MKDEELREALAEAKAERFNLRFQLATNQLDNHARIKDVKGDIARILTVLRERELASVEAGAGTEEGAR